MLEKFNGMFSFALWDKLNQEFYLCRDRLGIKPLYYLEENESIIFSSSLKAIKLFKYQELSINKDDIIDFLSFGTVHSPNTFIDEIKLIPRASLLMASNEETFIKEYWSFFNHQTS